VDDLLEKCSDNIDILRGKKKDKKEAEIEEELKKIKKMKESKVNPTMNMKILNTTDMFDIDNSYYPFIPKIKTKHFAIKELIMEIEDARRLRNVNADKFRQINFEDRKLNKDSSLLFEHPYVEEINTLVNRVVDRMDCFNNHVKREYFSNHSINRLDSIVNFKPIKIADIVSEHGMNGAIKKIQEINKFHNFFFTENNPDSDSYKDILEQIEFEFPPLEWTKFIYIDTPEAFLAMIEEIEQIFQEIAVDLEHHSQESYLGITCLMQISTRLTDYVIDTIKLRPYIHEINRIFCNPSIVKVLHGADFDVEWLQKDFGVYIVNMFDTGQACRVLMLPSFSLANLLNTLCNISADKKYQLSDWRIRPLPAEMLKYAREDTHYLLYIYDILKKKLIYKSCLKPNEDILFSFLLTYKKSNELCLKQYTKPAVKSQEYYQLLSRNITVLNKRNVSILKVIYKFRDYVGRKLDLNPHHVLSNKNIFTLIRLPGNNLNAETIYQNLEKNSHIRNFVHDLAKLIEAKLKKNEEKIDKGMTSKFLEKNYIENMKEKFEDSKNIVRNLKINLNNTKKKLEITKKPETITKEELKLAGIEIAIKTKKGSKFFEEEKENTNKLNKSHPHEFNAMYDKVLENFNNFNIISYLKEKHPNLKNMKIEKKEGSVRTVEKKEKTSAVVERLGKSIEDVTETEKVSNQEIKQQENLLKQKRKGEDLADIYKIKGHIDLTDYKRVNLFKPQREFSEDEDEAGSQIEEEEEYTTTHRKKKEIVNLKSIQSESVKNMIASANFLKGKFNLLFF